MIVYIVEFWNSHADGFHTQGVFASLLQAKARVPAEYDFIGLSDNDTVSTYGTKKKKFGPRHFCSITATKIGADLPY